MCSVFLLHCQIFFFLHRFSRPIILQFHVGQACLNTQTHDVWDFHWCMYVDDSYRRYCCVEEKRRKKKETRVEPNLLIDRQRDKKKRKKEKEKKNLLSFFAYVAKRHRRAPGVGCWCFFSLLIKVSFFRINNDLFE